MPSRTLRRSIAQDPAGQPARSGLRPSLLVLVPLRQPDENSVPPAYYLTSRVARVHVITAHRATFSSETDRSWSESPLRRLIRDGILGLSCELGSFSITTSGVRSST